jgi:hypothetical protein
MTALAVYGTWFVLNERWRVGPIRRRHGHGVLWLAAVPSSDRTRVDGLLSAVCDAFLIPRCYRFRLRPSDDIHTLYRRNMRGQFADSMEYNHLMRRLEEDFGLDARHLVAARPCTVGRLVRCVTKPRSCKAI